MMNEHQDDGTDIDRVAILAEIYARNRLRIEAQLPRLNIRQEFEHIAAVRAWRIHYDRHHDRLRAEILAQQRAKFGDGWGYSAGGRWALNILTEQALRASYAKP